MKNSEYLVDRLRYENKQLEKEIVKLNAERTEIIIAEIVLALVCLSVGYVLGALFS